LLLYDLEECEFAHEIFELDTETLENHCEVLAQRAILPFSPKVNRVLPENVGTKLFNPMRAGINSLSSPFAFMSLAPSHNSDVYDYASGKYDGYQLAGALTVDTGITLTAALGSGFAAGLAAGAVAGVIAGPPGIVIGGIVGGIIGATVAVGITYAFYDTGFRDTAINGVADMYAGRGAWGP
jgi:hypothetical protein